MRASLQICFPFPPTAAPLLRVEASAVTSLIKALCWSWWILTANCHLQSFAVSCIPEHWLFHLHQLIKAATKRPWSLLAENRLFLPQRQAFPAVSDVKSIFSFSFSGGETHPSYQFVLRFSWGRHWSALSWILLLLSALRDPALWLEGRQALSPDKILLHLSWLPNRRIVGYEESCTNGNLEQNFWICCLGMGL